MKPAPESGEAAVTRKPRPAPARTQPEAEGEFAPAEGGKTARRQRREQEEPAEEVYPIDERPPKARGGSAKKSSNAILWIALAGVGGLFLVCGACAGVGYFWWERRVAAFNSEFEDVARERMATSESREPLAGPKPPAGGWKEFRSEQYGFTVLLPGTPREGLVNQPDHGKFELDVPAEQPFGPEKSGYQIDITTFPAADDPLKSEFVLDSLPELGRAGVGFGGDGGKIVNRKAGIFAGHPGRAWDVVESRKNPGTWRFRACLAGTRAHILRAGPDSKVSSADADKFFASFEVRAK
jgi:hypothetical protein